MPVINLEEMRKEQAKLSPKDQEMLRTKKGEELVHGAAKLAGVSADNLKSRQTADRQALRDPRKEAEERQRELNELRNF